MRRIIFGLVTLATMACQKYDFVYQPDADRQGTHLRFVVEQPSKADILFVIDNSISMVEEQQALSDSVGVLLAALAPQDTRYRIGITSTDAIGYKTNCLGAEEAGLIDWENPGAKGDCARPEVILRRPHDGALGRLIAAYDPRFFSINPTLPDPANPNPVLFHPDGSLRTEDGLTPELLPILARALPNTPFTHPADPVEYDFEDFPGFKGEQGVRWVIDRETIRFEACQACECTQGDGAALVCDEEADCFDSCVATIAPKLVEAYFRSNISGLGIGGQGWEEGLKSAAYSIGIEPQYENEELALNPTDNLIRVPGGTNTFMARSDAGIGVESSWVRDEALLAVMFVSDEEDCSMPQAVWDSRCWFEEGCPDGAGGVLLRPGYGPLPQGSLCYQDEIRDILEGPESLVRSRRIAELVTKRKGDSISRVAVGFIGGVEAVGSYSVGSAVDCAVVPGSPDPTSICSCLNAPWIWPDRQPECDGWCAYTRDDQGICAATPPDNPPYCDALAGSRYLNFSNVFRRRTYDSVCKAESGTGFGDAMARFAQIATLACFELEGVDPANKPDLTTITDEAQRQQVLDDLAAKITVKRAARADAEIGIPPSLLEHRDSSALEEGWYLDADENDLRICLTGLDRLIGDVYDIFVLTEDKLDFTN